MRWMHVAALSAALTGAAQAQEQDSIITPSPYQSRNVYTTKEPKENTLPWLGPVTQDEEKKPASVFPQIPKELPFKRAQPGFLQPVPTGPYSTRAVPVENIDAIEVSEPAAPADATQVANPASEDPAQPTDLTSPMFAASKDDKAPRVVVLRVLNKVTAHSEVIEARPGEAVSSGKLQVKPLRCYRSLPSSQPDAVALLDIAEHVPEQVQPKLLFHGWMYESSPSITALEHPVYDVTMVDCKIQTASAPKEKPEKPAKKKSS